MIVNSLSLNKEVSLVEGTETKDQEGIIKKIMITEVTKEKVMEAWNNTTSKPRYYPPSILLHFIR